MVVAVYRLVAERASECVCVSVNFFFEYQNFIWYISIYQMPQFIKHSHSEWVL